MRNLRQQADLFLVVTQDDKGIWSGVSPWRWVCHPGLKWSWVGSSLDGHMRLLRGALIDEIVVGTRVN